MSNSTSAPLGGNSNGGKPFARQRLGRRPAGQPEGQPHPQHDPVHRPTLLHSDSVRFLTHATLLWTEGLHLLGSPPPNLPET